MSAEYEGERGASSRAAGRELPSASLESENFFGSCDQGASGSRPWVGSLGLEERAEAIAGAIAPGGE